MALALAREGAHVVICARSPGALEDLDDEIRAIGGKATILKLDLRAGDRIDQLGPVLYQRWGKLDILVSNAAHQNRKESLEDVTDDEFDRTFKTNIYAYFRLAR